MTGRSKAQILYFAISLMALVFLCLLSWSFFKREINLQEELTECPEAGYSVMQEHEEHGFSFRLAAAGNGEFLLVQTPGRLPARMLYFYIDDRDLVDPFITRLRPSAVLQAPGEYCFKLSHLNKSEGAIKIFIADLYAKEFFIRTSLPFHSAETGHK